MQENRSIGIGDIVNIHSESVPEKIIGQGTVRGTIDDDKVVVQNGKFSWTLSVKNVSVAKKR